MTLAAIETKAQCCSSMIFTGGSLSSSELTLPDAGALMSCDDPSPHYLI
jgi:hypothetical protein